MDIFNATHNRLLQNGFNEHGSEAIEKLSASLYKSSVYNVILKRLHYKEEMKSITSFSLQIRSLLVEYNFNIWNTYILFCVDQDIDFETNYKIERDTKALRKYAISNKADLNRIPFLDEFRVIKKPIKNEVSIEENNEYLKEIMNYLEKNEGRHNKLNSDQVENLIGKILNMVELRYEDQ